MRHLDDGSLQAWLDGERSGLERAELEALEKHLEVCPDCAARAEELDALALRTTTLLAGHVRDEPLPAYRQVVGRARVLGRSGRRRGWTVSAWAASVAVALGAGWTANELYRGDAAPLIAPRTEAAVDPASSVARAAEGRATAVADGPPSGADAGAAPPAEERSTAPVPAPAPPPEPTPTATASTPTPPGTALVPDPSGNVAAAPAQSRDPATPAPEPRGPVVKGRVVDAQTGQPIPAAQVYIADLDVGVLSLEDGSFRLPLFEEDVDEDPLTLTVQRIGYRTESREFTADPGDTVLMDFHIHEEALQLDEIIVTGTPGGTQRRALGNAVTTTRPAIRISSEDPALGAGAGWSARAAAEARAAVGFAIASVPGLEVGSVEVGRVGGVNALRVRQSLGPRTTLTLIQARAPILLEGATTLDERTVSVIRRGDVSIVGAAAVALDSLNALLSRVR